MDEAHKQGITIWSDVSISFFHLFAAWIFFLLFRKLNQIYMNSYKIKSTLDFNKGIENMDICSPTYLSTYILLLKSLEDIIVPSCVRTAHP